MGGIRVVRVETLQLVLLPCNVQSSVVSHHESFEELNDSEMIQYCRVKCLESVELEEVYVIFESIFFREGYSQGARISKEIFHPWLSYAFNAYSLIYSNHQKRRL